MREQGAGQEREPKHFIRHIPTFWPGCSRKPLALVRLSASEKNYYEKVTSYMLVRYNNTYYLYATREMMMHININIKPRES